jgi:uncharacterized membrane protein
MRQRLAPLGTLSLAFALRVYQLADLSVWLDEGNSIYAARLALPELLEYIASRSHPPLYFILLHGWIRLGGNEFMLRFLSVVWGLIGVAALYTLGRRLCGERTALIATLLLAVSPIHVWHSQDARMYTMLFALVVLSSYLLVQALSHNRAGYWLGYAMLASLSLYTHNTALFTILAQSLFAMLYIITGRRWSLLKGVGAALGGIVLLYLPWLPLSVSQASHLRQYFWIARPTARTVLETLEYLSSTLLFTQTPWHSGLDTWPGAWVYLTYLGLLILGSWQLVRHRTKWTPIIFLLLGVPIAAEFAVSFVRPIYLNRTLLVVAAPLLLIYGAAPSGHRSIPRWAGSLLLVIGLCCNIVSLTNLYNKAQKEEWRQAANLVATRAQHSDVIFFDQAHVQPPFDYYFHQQETVIEEYGYPYEFSLWRSQKTMDAERWWIYDYVKSDPNAAMSRLTDIAQQHSVVWLVVNRPLSEGRLLTWLTEHSDHTEIHEFYSVMVYRFEMSPRDEAPGSENGMDDL